MLPFHLIVEMKATPRKNRFRMHTRHQACTSERTAVKQHAARGGTWQLEMSETEMSHDVTKYDVVHCGTIKTRTWYDMYQECTRIVTAAFERSTHRHYRSVANSKQPHGGGAEILHSVKSGQVNLVFLGRHQKQQQ